MGHAQDASGGMIRTVGVIQQGIEQDVAKRISKDIKAEKFKVKVQIESEKLRVSGPKRERLAGGHLLPARAGLRHSAAVRQLPLGACT